MSSILIAWGRFSRVHEWGLTSQSDYKATKTRAPLDLFGIWGNYLLYFRLRGSSSWLDLGNCCRPPEGFQSRESVVACLTLSGPLPGTPLDSGLPLRVCCCFALSSNFLAQSDLSVCPTSRSFRFDIGGLIGMSASGPPRTGRIPLGFPRSNPAFPIPSPGLIRENSRAPGCTRFTPVANR